MLAILECQQFGHNMTCVDIYYSKNNKPVYMDHY